MPVRPRQARRNLPSPRHTLRPTTLIRITTPAMGARFSWRWTASITWKGYWSRRQRSASMCTMPTPARSLAGSCGRQRGRFCGVIHPMLLRLPSTQPPMGSVWRLNWENRQDFLSRSRCCCDSPARLPNRARNCLRFHSAIIPTRIREVPTFFISRRQPQTASASPQVASELRGKSLQEMGLLLSPFGGN